MLPRYLKNFDTAKLRKEESDFLVIGTGIAGLVTALNLAKSGKVTLLSKERLAECNTEYAQGGIAAVIAKEDTPQSHYQDTLEAGAGLCNPKAVDILVNEGSKRIKELIDLGVNFDRKGEQILLTKEAAHSCRRILHAGGDATGREIRKSLVEQVASEDNVTLEDGIFAVDLLTDNQEVHGILAYDRRQEEYLLYLSKVVVLATGGAGQIYHATSNPSVATGDGIALAYRAGAKVTDLEFVQFHPTTLELEGVDNFLISEAVRGEGGVLRNQAGDRFMTRYHQLADLAPRDIVARAIYQEMKVSGADHVYLDVTALDSAFIKKRFPTIYRTCLDHGIDISQDYIPVAPAAHYLMGGILSNLHGETNIKGLFACGETACIGIHGANRLASNSLLDGLVFGKRVADRATTYLNQGDFSKGISLKYEAQSTIEDIGKIPSKERVKGLMSAKLGIVRERTELEKGLAEADNLLAYLNYDLSNVHDFELQNLITLAHLSFKGALYREESRGAHYRKDFPVVETAWEKHIILQKDREWEELAIEFE
ncbi:L-aspartate oxidase [Orenia metallireducens]|uniref:L-aspartate oxidase n=1 Tax=Orenia metallireducens TaxID=1413210 RepID=A0A285HCY4_9FIRM|nr:L-aspartate oxidase [Orenia metallireducens]PRX27717.1 L-aspartate oxidase [Orenia metallireducens]SNY33598.1 L-aspartate oxidase [Orenia metallireducens]